MNSEGSERAKSWHPSEIEAVHQSAADFLRNVHGVKDVDWGKMLVPFIRGFFSTCPRTVEDFEPDSALSAEFVIPFVKGGYEPLPLPYSTTKTLANLPRFRLGLFHPESQWEAQTAVYQQLTKGHLPSQPNFRLEIPNESFVEQKIKRAVYPLSDLSRIAYLRYINRRSKLLFYALSGFSINRCNFSYLQPSFPDAPSPLRTELKALLCRDFSPSQAHSWELLAYSLPTVYLENFEFYYEKAAHEARKMTRIGVIYCDRDSLDNPTMLILLSLNMMRRKTVFAHQHGAVYGQVGPSIDELTEKSLCDRFLTWGHKNDAKDLPFLCLKFRRTIGSLFASATSKLTAPTGTDALVVVQVAYLPSIFARIRNSLKILREALPSNTAVTVRLDPREQNQEFIEETLSELGINYALERSGLPLVEVAPRFRTIIFTSPCGTGYLELLAANIFPFMVFSGGDYSFIPESADYYYALKKSGVWIDNDNVSEAQLGRMDGHQRQALKAFCDNFVRMGIAPDLQLVILLIGASLRQAYLSLMGE